MTTATEAIKANEERVQRMREAAERARQLEGEIRSARADLVRHEKKREAYAVHGSKKIEVANPYRSDLWPLVELEPFRSKHTGDELAAAEQSAIDHLTSRIARLEAEIESALADAH